jgi:hypothetical protein
MFNCVVLSLWFGLQSVLTLTNYSSVTPCRLLSHLIHTHILTPTHLPTLLKEARTALFPNNLLSPPRDPPTPAPAEQAAIRRTCAQQILSLVPPVVARVYLGRSPRGPRAPPSPFPSHSGSDTDGRAPHDHDEVAVAYGGSEEKVSKIEGREKEKGEAVTDALGIDRGVEKGVEETEFHIAEIEAVLDVFGDSYMNKHLIFAIVECLLGALVPEMQERGSGELLGERLG